MPRTRFHPPDRLLGATAFTGDEAVSGPLETVRLLKANRWLWRDLREACDLDHRYGRRRERGNWELIAVAFVVSGQVDIQPWHAASGEELWTTCGFAAKPSYRTTWRRLRELAMVADAFLTAVGALVRRARAQDGRVFAHSHFDNTEDETHAALEHDCERGQCPRGRGGPQAQHAAGRGRAGARLRPHRQDTKAFRSERQQLNALVPQNPQREEQGHTPGRVELVQRGSRTVKRVKVGGCWYRTLDLDAGIRAYMGPRGAKRFWHGYYSGKAIDHFTGGVIPIVESASLREHAIFERHYDLVCELLGEAPETAIGDKGLSIASCFEKCTTGSTAPVFPWRPGGGDFKRHDKDTHDRHGVPRCQHCGGPTDFRRFSAGDRSLPPERRHPRIWFRCMVGATPECDPEQTIACSNDYRLLVPLWRTHELYHELKESHGSYEAQHDWWRDRYKVAADDIGIRPKVRDIGFHRLRANVASLIEWLRICFREGWLGNPRRNHRGTTRSFQDRGRRIAVRLAEMRARVGLLIPYGERAAELFGSAQRTPPSRRPRGAPPGQTQLDLAA